MTNEERDLITAFIARVAGVAPQPPGGMASPQGSPWASPSVPATPAPSLPPIDPEADALLAALFQRYPEARYRLAQLAFVQEHALAAAQARIYQLEAQLRQTAPAQSHGGFFSGLFGGGRAAPTAGPGPAAPPGYPPGAPPGYPSGYPSAYPQAAPGGYPPGGGMFSRGGSGFLGSALTTAAGVAGGMVVGNALMDLFSPHHAFGGGFGGETGIEPAASPWGGAAGGAAGGAPAGGNDWDNVRNDAGTDNSWDNASSDPGSTGSGWDNASSDPGSTGSGWDDASNAAPDDDLSSGFDDT